MATANIIIKGAESMVWTEITLLNGAIKDDPSNWWSTPSYAVDSNGMCHLRGRISLKGTDITEKPIARLPVSNRQTGVFLVREYYNTGFAGVRVHDTGEVILEVWPNHPMLVHLDGISFPIK